MSTNAPLWRQPHHRLRHALGHPKVQVTLAVLLVLAVFVAAFVLWSRSTRPDVAAAGRSDASTSSAASTPNRSGDANGAAGRSTAPATDASLPPLPGAGASVGQNSTRLRTLGPGTHRVEIVLRSDSPMLSVAYAVKGDRAAHSASNVGSPVVVVRTIAGTGPFAAASLQVSPTSHRGSCQISIDGKVVVTRAVDHPYGTTACVA